MVSTSIPGDIQDFLAHYLPGLDYLETFIVLQRNASRLWSATDVSAELRIPTATAEQVLERLASDNFLEVKIANELLYRFNPATAALETSAAHCADLYVHERIAMISLVTAKDDA